MPDNIKTDDLVQLKLKDRNMAGRVAAISESVIILDQSDLYNSRLIPVNRKDIIEVLDMIKGGNA